MDSTYVPAHVSDAMKKFQMYYVYIIIKQNI